MSFSLVKSSKKLAYLLRHSDITMDENGWVYVNDILRELQINRQDLELIVMRDDKRRYSFSDTGGFIKANQGHSVDIDQQFTHAIPPSILWHGSSTKYFHHIAKDGIRKMGRHHVHLSDNIDTAINVGRRHGRLIVYNIDTISMIHDGYEFYITENDVWLTNKVPFKYINYIRINGEIWSKT